MYWEYRIYFEQLLFLFSSSGSKTAVRLMSNESKKITARDSDIPEVQVEDGDRTVRLFLYKNSFDSRIPKVDFIANSVASKDTITILAAIQVGDKETKYLVNFDPEDASDEHYALEEFSEYICSALQIE